MNCLWDDSYEPLALVLELLLGWESIAAHALMCFLCPVMTVCWSCLSISTKNLINYYIVVLKSMARCLGQGMYLGGKGLMMSSLPASKLLCEGNGSWSESRSVKSKCGQTSGIGL